MLKKTDKYAPEDLHFSKKSSKQNSDTNAKDIIIFISVFIAGVLILLGFAKILSPNVDVGIADNSEYSQTEEIEEEENQDQASVDERLKALKMEDEGKLSEDKIFSSELDEKVVLPNQKQKTVGEYEAELQKELNNTRKEIKEFSKSEIKQENAPQTNQSAPVQETKQAPTPHSVNAKVVVGYYESEKQAEVAKSIIQDAGVGVSPIVKNMGGYYSLQVGAYSSKEKAQQAANNLLKSNFPARVIVE
jgi:hypothetical protein